MSDPIAFRPRPPADVEHVPNSGNGFMVTLKLGPFVVDGPEPVWAGVAALVIAECRRAWDARYDHPLDRKAL